jgi:ABC-type multidrug transport system ATPase subunit
VPASTTPARLDSPNDTSGPALRFPGQPTPTDLPCGPAGNGEASLYDSGDFGIRADAEVRDQVALDDVSLSVGAGTITGLLGRNGAGKTTLLRILAGQEFASSGEVRVLGASPLENKDMLGRTGSRSGSVGRGSTVFIREDQEYPDLKVRHALRAASWFYPNWDAELAETLIDDFGLRMNKTVKRLSRGMRSALGITIGLAARTEVTLFDEPYAGLDAAADGLRGAATRVSGPSLTVDSFTESRPVWE